MAFARHPGIKCQSVIDERSAGFIALGMGQRYGLPMAVICTSGSAVVNLYPAVVEAFYQRIPLIIITADRPPELIDQWDGQAIHQPGIFGKHVKASINLPDNYNHPEKFSETVFEAVKTASSGIRAPLHINVPLREPLYTGVKEEFVYPNVPQLLADFYGSDKEPLSDLTELQAALNKYKKVLAVVGNQKNGMGTTVVCDKTKGKIPFVCDVLSNQLTAYTDLHQPDMLLSIPNPELMKALQPDVLLTFGTSVVSKNLKQFLRSYKPKYHFHFSEYVETADPFGTSPIEIHGYLREVFEKLYFDNLDTEYNAFWQKYDNKIAEINQKFLSETPFWEMAAVSRVLKHLPEKSHLQLANSMSIRWVNILGEKLSGSVYVTGNRGVSGIDGCTSTAVGAAYADYYLGKEYNNEQKIKFITLITGDVAFFYDSNALWNKFVTPNLRIVILNNGGGGIFRMIDGPGQMPELEEFVETTHTRTAKLLAMDMNVEYTQVENFEELEAALKVFYNPSERPKILEIITDSKINTEYFKQYKTLIHNGLENI